MRKALQDQQDVNLHLRKYIDSVLLNIMEKYPELLEVRCKWWWDEWPQQQQKLQQQQQCFQIDREEKDKAKLARSWFCDSFWLSPVIKIKILQPGLWYNPPTGNILKRKQAWKM